MQKFNGRQSGKYLGDMGSVVIREFDGFQLIKFQQLISNCFPRLPFKY